MTLKTSILVLLCIVTTIHLVSAAKKNLSDPVFVAVIPMTAGFEKYYKDVSLLNLERLQRLMKDEKIEEKKKLCTAIFSNPVLASLGVDTVDPSADEIQKELQEKHPKIYSRFFVGPPERAAKFTNFYQSLNISFGEDSVLEFVMSCFVRNRASNNLEEYLVSRAYAKPRSHSVAGHEAVTASRFVFKPDDQGKPVLTAMVDRPVVTLHNLNPKYCEEKSVFREGMSETLCNQVPEIQRIRLCSILFNEKKYREIAKYTNTENVDPECKKTELVAWCDSEGVTYTDYVLECKADAIEPNSGPIIRYLSHGVKDYQFFVSQHMDNSSGPGIIGLFYSYLVNLVSKKKVDDRLAYL